jgi:hypothetical protein
MLNAALEYAKKGKPVFPLHGLLNGQCTCGKDCGNNRSKHPRILGGFKNATVDEAKIREWWNLWPDANIGVPTGQPSHFVVLDIDPRHGGQDSLAQLQVRYGPLPDTLRQNTGGGGYHLAFSSPEGAIIHNSTGLSGFEGLDVRGDGGYIVVAPSLHHSGNCYKWDKSTPRIPAELPQWLLDLMTNKQDRDKNHGNAKAYFDMASMLAGVPEGRRNDTLFRAACKLRNADVPEDWAMQLILKAAENCKPSLPEDEAQEIVSHTYRAYDAGPAITGRQFRSVADVPSIDAVPNVRVEWVVDRMIPRKSITILSAVPGGMKSYIALDIARCVASGLPFAGRKTQSLPVLYLDRENPDSVIQERKRFLEIASTPGLRYWGVWCTEWPAHIDDPRLLEFAEEGGVIIVDSLIRFSSAKDENDSAQMATVMERFRQLQRLGATVLVLHHASEKSGYGYRGSTEILGGCDEMYTARKVDDFTVELSWKQKTRYGVDKQVALKRERGGYVPTEVKPQRIDDITDEEALAVMIELATKNPGLNKISLCDLGAEQNISQRSARAALAKMENDPRMRVEEGPRNAKLFFPVFDPLQEVAF